MMISSGAFASQSLSPRAKNSWFQENKPIYIKSNFLEVKDESKKASFIGNVVATQEDVSLKAEEMVIFYNNADPAAGSKIDYVNINKRVFVQSKVRQVIADSGFFDFRKRNLVFQGKEVILKEGLNTYLGCMLVVNLNTDEAKLQACESQQVQVEIFAKTQNNPT
ncbi:LptA/OstA family protein [Candidatus Liberibacter sp.]|uniref:LptA/OstA family protein n=1 Tax=Candidatus Liberibacter sp. TaxID=34022 RepID=UPI0015F5BA9F|nr:LptA/OstA family protein [Candidatus Liberibacter sp.]MBA5723918.1 OstA family protein [Candidatus Liberibacter sp.]